MPNVHFAEIGDLWKHLPLSTILEEENPQHYWETHSGSAIYNLQENTDWKKEFGVLHFFRNRKTSKTLSMSKYTSLLESWTNAADSLQKSPGSPIIAMLILKEPKSLVFCDIAPESLDSISSTASTMGKNINSALQLKKQDGISTISECADNFTSDPQSTFVFLDPYEITTKSEKLQLNCIDLFGKLLKMGMKCALWYGFDTSEDRKKKENLIKEKLKESDINNNNIWWGEIVFDMIDNIKMNPGVPGGCTMIIGNCKSSTYDKCEQLGKELEPIYKNKCLPDGMSGSIRFEIIKY